MSKFYTGNMFFCGTQIPRGSTTEKCKWQSKDITYYENMNLPGLSREEISRAFDEAWKQISDVCDIRPRRIFSSVGANVVATEGRIDGTYGTLAWSYIACNSPPTATMDQLYDNGENWNYRFLVATACHELMHANGVPHLGYGNLMAPMLDMNITKPQAGDITELQARYGPPVGPAPPVPTPPIPIPPTPVPTPTPIIPLTPNGRFTSHSLSPDEIKIFSLKIPQTLFGNGKNYIIVLKGESLIGSIYDPEGRIKGTFGKNGRMSVRLYPGEHIIHVRKINMGSGGTFQIGAAKGG